MRKFVLPVLIGVFCTTCLAATGCGTECETYSDAIGGTMKISSPAFENGGAIPKKYTCDGENINPILVFSDLPDSTKSTVLICDDPDASSGHFTHWLIYDIHPLALSISENEPKTRIMTNGSRQGQNDFGEIGWGGPCPPSGTHRYVFKLYALDKMLNLDLGAKRKTVEVAMQGHIIAEAELTGTYGR
ncbi:MAG TPA: YbhB/YbcL family Raf kinase inhibitor-like protein [Caldisericia bacterium]|nr:YbhB/YbcL family Raf kinase inhibitor-like protein [Caldisericia bacterium]HOR47164.1 YbhB/YbcL family Raf kinase inhibitor-like protein [Caldisericia bacterium]HOU07792.1 YbhB/YbcL family Raf kinase inhibitor-like protein [Caldisericia bacterium]HQG59362.1 YbhB/YbcL family Raf kinase inhibitor-like protein [Caldisericia bacterium]HQH48406.1 YbhB/YbcL family Raf kinase inhibitor-like protein [Caldisericia bacterium]